MNDERPPLTGMMESIRRLITLNLDYARLTAAEKLSVLMSAIAFFSVLTLLVTIVLFFISFGIGFLLARTIAPDCAYLYVAAFYAVLALLLVIFRRKLFSEPVTRFVTRLFVKPPQDHES